MNDATNGRELTQAQLESHLLYALIVAGKTATFANDKTALLLLEKPRDINPVAWLSTLDKRGKLDAQLRKAGTGRYRILARAIRWLAQAGLDLRAVTPAQLEACPGIGAKTSRFFVVWTRPHERHAVLDVHVLRWLRTQGIDAPRQTPTGANYHKLEKAFLDIAAKAGVHPRKLDLAIWSAGATAPNEAPQ